MSERMEVVSVDHENGTVLAKFAGEAMTKEQEIVRDLRELDPYDGSPGLCMICDARRCRSH